MNELFWFGISLVLVFLSTMIALTGQLSTVARWAVIGLFAGFICMGGVTAVNLLSRPMPLAWYRALPWNPELNSVQVIGYSAERDKAIYLVIKIPGDPKPVSLILPWSESTAASGDSAMTSLEEAGPGAELMFSAGGQGPSGGVGTFQVGYPEALPVKEPSEQDETINLNVTPAPAVPAQMPNSETP